MFSISECLLAWQTCEQLGRSQVVDDQCREGAVYRLGDRGLRVVSGRNADDSGADSNGTGKSSLVMAALWCMTGRSDARTMASFLHLSPKIFQASCLAEFCRHPLEGVARKVEQA